MNTAVLRRGLVAAAAFSATALVLAGCAGSTDSSSDSGSSDERITLTVNTFNDFGYTDELAAEYEAEHPNVDVVFTKAATSNDSRTNYFQKLGKTGLADIEAIEVDWLPEVMKYSDLLAPVSEDLTDRWLDWKVEAATDADGNLIGYGTDIGPEAVCYRSSLFEEAGLPTDPDEVAALLEGDWDTYFSVAKQYSDATGKAFYDTATSVYQGMINQVKAAYEDPETGEITATDNAEVADIFNEILDNDASSAGLTQWSDDWYAGLSNGAFATMLCPGWMLGTISGSATETTDWKIANVFPGGGGNWGGSYLTVPANGANVEAAQELADWLTSPETQIKAFNNAGTFPSQTEALKSDDLLSATNEYFNDAPTGQIFTDRANAITVTPFKGEFYFQINDAIVQALQRVEQGTQDAATSFKQWQNEVKAIG